MDDIVISTMVDEAEIELMRGKSSFDYSYDEVTIDSLKKHFKLKDSLYLAVRSGTALVGFCSMDTGWWEENFFFIREIWVDSGFQKQGIGNALISRCLEHARAKKANGVVTETAFKNILMQRLCEKFGFQSRENPQWKEGMTYKILF